MTVLHQLTKNLPAFTLTVDNGLHVYNNVTVDIDVVGTDTPTKKYEVTVTSKPGEDEEMEDNTYLVLTVEAECVATYSDSSYIMSWESNYQDSANGSGEELEGPFLDVFWAIAEEQARLAFHSGL